MFPSPYELLLFLHVAVAFALVGGSLSAPRFRGAIRAAGSSAEMRQWIGFARRATRLNPAAALIVLATGIWLGSQGWWTEGWFYVSIAAWLANSLLAVLVVNRTEESLEKAVDAGGTLEAVDSIRFATKWDVATASMLANDFALIWIMMQKPSATASLVVIVAANALLIGIARARRGSAPRHEGRERSVEVGAVWCVRPTRLFSSRRKGRDARTTPGHGNFASGSRSHALAWFRKPIFG